MEHIKELMRLLEECKACFCLLCSHKPEYGHCYLCPCGNHVEESALPDGTEIPKLKATVEFMRDILRHLREEDGIRNHRNDLKR